MKRPIIGIISRPANVFNTIDVQAIEELNRNVIIKAGGIPILILPPQTISYQTVAPGEVKNLTDEEKEIIKSQLDLCDGIFAPGGLKAYEYDYFISDYAKEKNIPFLGLCLGMQIMARSNGNATILKNDSTLPHHNSKHSIKIDKDSILHSILLNNEIIVNSFHNYHIEDVKNFLVIARSEDGIIEAIEDNNHPYRIGVQWHPEKNYEDDHNSRKIFKSFIEAASTYKLSKRN